MVLGLTQNGVSESPSKAERGSLCVSERQGERGRERERLRKRLSNIREGVRK